MNIVNRQYAILMHMLRLFRHRKMQIALAFLTLLTAAGTFIFWELEDWTVIDALYFTVATLTTVGYGDVVPTLPATKLLATLYMILVVPMILIGIGIVSDIVERQGNIFRKDV
jgi:voltage-gated potassium channel